MNLKDKAVAVGTLASVLLLIGVDGYTDWIEGEATGLIALDMALTLGGIMGIGYLGWYILSSMRNRIVLSERKSESLRSDAEYWKREASRHLNGLSHAIDRQFDRWELTRSEKDVALLLLKGLSVDEAATVREVKPRTIRNQSLSIYGKAGLRGRSDLAGFFLEDLLAPTREIRDFREYELVGQEVVGEKAVQKREPPSK